MRTMTCLGLMAVTLLLAACGADGPPVAPSALSATPGMTITGTVRTGIARDGG